MKDARKGEGTMPVGDGAARAGDDAARVDGHLITLLAPQSFEADQYRTLGHVLERSAGGAAVIGVTSACAGEGKTTTSINLAGALARDAEARVLLVDADLRAPSVAALLGLDRTLPGLVDALDGPDAGPGGFIRWHPSARLSILTAGRSADKPYEILKTPRASELFAEARRRYDVIVVDTPPVLPVPDCRLIARLVDRFVLVVAAHRTPRAAVGEALTLLEGSKVAGIVFNGDDRAFAGYRSYDGYGRGTGNRIAAAAGLRAVGPGSGSWR